MEQSSAELAELADAIISVSTKILTLFDALNMSSSQNKDKQLKSHTEYSV